VILLARIYPLFSSSKGNSTYIGSKTCGILIDAGVSYSRLVKALSANDIDISAVKGVFITHEHSDHISGVKMLTKKAGIPVFAQAYTLESLFKSEAVYSCGEVITESICIAGMEVKCFDTPHDTEQSCGYKITFENGKTCAVCTDLGHVTSYIEQTLLGTDAVLLESNYDETMLKNGSYPSYLKTRIKSKFGHLSNNDSGKFAEKLVQNGTTRIILGHLSQENNTPRTADNTVSGFLSEYKRDRDYILTVAPVETAGCFTAF
jgi:phosphoribosyl 1,2-cyclic phosphodiesterase